MRSLFLWALSLCLLTSTHAATYYFSSTSGDDSHSASQAQDPSTPWKSINKLNAIFSSLQPGDVVFFKRGDTFYGTIKPTKSGTSSEPITFGSYGSGSKPLITGFVTLSNWESVGGGKYESYHTSLGSAVNVVNFDGKNQEMGRYPNSNTANGGYLSYESHGNNFIEDDELTSSTDWTGAEVVVRTNRFVIDRSKIASHSSSRIYYSTPLSYAPLDGFGYFIQNDIGTLDKLGEWYYNSSTQKMTVYFGSGSPDDYPVKASVLNRLVDIYFKDNIIFEDLAFSGANQDAFYLYSADNIQIKNCDITFSDDHAIFASHTQSLQVQSNVINHSQNAAIKISDGANALIKGNRISNTGILSGMGINGTNKSVAIFETGRYHTIEGNSIENTGYIAIRFSGNYALIKNNYIDTYNLTKDDGGGIYTNNPVGVVTTGQKIIGNIVLNGIGAAGGTSSSVANYTKGIYLDDRSTNVEVAGNTVAHNNNTGVYIHNSTSINLHDNVIYDNDNTQIQMTHNHLVADNPLRNMIIKNNILVAKTAAQKLLFIKTLGNDIKYMGSFDNNTFSRPLDKDGYFITTYHNTATSTVAQVHNLSSWQNLYDKDINSRVSTTYVQPHKINTLKGSNLFANSSFDDDINGLNASSAVSFTKNWLSSKLDAGTFQGALTSSTPSMYITSTPIGAVTAGKKYVVKFTAQSSKDASMNVYFRKSASPYTILSNDGAKKVVDFTTSRKEYEFVFSPKVSESNTVLFIEINGKNQSFWIDNLKVQEADAELTDPDEHIKLLYNESGSSKTVGLSGTYADVKSGKSYSGSIALAPYTSVVLIKTSEGQEATDRAPVVALTSPDAGNSYTAPATVQLTATASDADGSISKVEFYNGSTLITTEYELPYNWTWNDVPAGTHTITAKAYDNSGNVTTSDPVTITIRENNSQADHPDVSLISPTVNATYTAPATVQLWATASDADGSVTKVEFYHGSNLILTEYNAPYRMGWKNVLPGTYTITAKAYDNSGNETTSAPVTITVYESNIGSGPEVTLVSPTANATFTAPATVELGATASDADGSVTKVEFYHGSNLILTEYNAPYRMGWKNVLPGTYIITARAYDNDGNVTTSAPVTITVTAESMALASIGSNDLMMSAPTTATGLRLYPNPAVNQIFVAYDAASVSSHEKANLTIRNIAGSVVKTMPVTLSGNGIEVDIASLAPGTYVLTVAGNGFNKTQKFVKNN